MAILTRALLFTLPRILNSTENPTRAAVAESSIHSQSLYRPIPNLFSRFYSSNDSISSQRINLSNEENKGQLVNRLVYRSKQRGYLELDLILGGWVEDHIRSLEENGIKALVHVLNLIFVAVHSKVMSNLDNHACPDTRTIPGKPWVRGWDDFKKDRDSPITGNQ